MFELSGGLCAIDSVTKRVCVRADAYHTSEEKLFVLGTIFPNWRIQSSTHVGSVWLYSKFFPLGIFYVLVDNWEIDTHNREFSPSAYNDSGHVEWFLSAMEKGKNDLRSGLSPLIECPCSNRIEKTTVNESQILNKVKYVIHNGAFCKIFAILWMVPSSPVFSNISKIRGLQLPSSPGFLFATIW